MQGRSGSPQETLEAWKDSNQWWKLQSCGVGLKLLNGWLDPQDTLVGSTSWKQWNEVSCMLLWSFWLGLFQHCRWSVTPHLLTVLRKKHCYVRHEEKYYEIREINRASGNWVFSSCFTQQSTTFHNSVSANLHELSVSTSWEMVKITCIKGRT